MNTSALNYDQQLMSCEICLKFIPVSESNSAETEDYVAYFCGLECYDLWKHQPCNPGPIEINPSKSFAK